MWPFYDNDNKFVDDLNIKIQVAEADLRKMEFDRAHTLTKLEIASMHINALENQKKLLKSNENKIVELREYRQIRDQLIILYNNENLLQQHAENLEVALGHCQKQIEHLNSLREASRFKVLEFKKRGTG